MYNKKEIKNKNSKKISKIALENLQLKIKLEEREKMHKEYMQLLAFKFEIKIPAKVQIGSSIFNVILTDADGKPVVETPKIESPKVEVKEKYIPNYVT
ncbi:MAG: hypothetical protein AABW89_05890 [Nanoarchaeota archaeon]